MHEFNSLNFAFHLSIILRLHAASVYIPIYVAGGDKHRFRLTYELHSHQIYISSWNMYGLWNARCSMCVCVCDESHKFPMLFSRISHTSLFFRKTEWKYSRRRKKKNMQMQTTYKAKGKKTIFIYSTFLLFIHGMYYANARARLWDTHGVRWCAIHNWEKSNEH